MGERPQQEIITPQVIEDLLLQLHDQGILFKLRSQVQHGEFFDPEQGMIDDIDDELTAGEVFDLYHKALIGDDPLASRSYQEAEKDNMLKAIARDAQTRRIIFAYYQISEETPWQEAVNNICNRQLHKEPDFPQSALINQIFQVLGDQA